MRFETVFIAGYALLLLLAAAGLRRIGRVSTDPWSSRVLAAYRAQAREPLEPATGADWPHSEVPRLHTAIAAVPCAAAALLCLAELVRHHEPAAVVLLGPVAVLAGRSTVRLLRELKDGAG